MSDPAPPPVDPDSPVPLGDLKRFTRRRNDPRRYVIPFLLAVLITIAAIAVLMLIRNLMINALS